MVSHRPDSLLSRFHHDRNGNFAVSFALVSSLIFVAVGLAVDFSMSLGTKTRINNALDAAALATGRALSTGEISDTGSAAQDYFKAVFAANVGDDAFDASVYKLKKFAHDPKSQSISAEVSVDQPLTFMRVGTGQQTQAVASRSAVSYGLGTIEIAMVLDVTGSMGYGSGSKLDNLKQAAKLGVTELLAANTESKEHVRISLVPYDYGVNAGPLAKYVYPDYLYAKSNAPAYDARYDKSSASYDSKLDIGGYGLGYDVASYVEQFYLCTKTTNGRPEVRLTIPDGDLSGYTCPGGTPDIDYLPKKMAINDDFTNVDKCATDRKEPYSDSLTNHEYQNSSPAYGMISRDSRLDSCPGSPLVLLTSKQSVLESALDGLSGGGFTAGQIGLQWAWYTISHDWADYIDGTASDPGDMTTDHELSKFIILMTDGIFNTAYAGTDVHMKYVTGETLWSQSRTLALCERIKSEGVKIFTIGYETPGSADRMLQSCASPDEGSFTYSYEPNSADDLKATYAAIANRIRTLRLSQ
ncbi:MAG: pilus assembly protein [Alphaproteobacteria bacterium]|nr:pilus assembly protein [Alphaproteobacteria bacterium]